MRPRRWPVGDLTDDELAKMSATAKLNCGCTTCRMTAEIRRGRSTRERRYADDGDGGCRTCGKPYTHHSAVAFTEPAEFRCPRISATAADKERVRQVVGDAVEEVYEKTSRDPCGADDAAWRLAVADRCADRLAPPAVRMSDSARRGLHLLRRHLDEDGHDWRAGTDRADVETARAWLDRLIGAAP